MRKLLLLSFLILLIPCVASATTRTAASCSAADVNTAIGLSSNGDTVLVPGGSCTWDTATNKVTISASQQIILNGQTTTTISFATNGVTSSGNALAVTAGTSFSTEIINFNFVGIYINGACPIAFNTTFSPLTKPFVFWNNAHTDSGSSTNGTMICVNGNGPGLISTNSFTATRGADELIHALGEGAGNTTAWAEDVFPGDSNAVFIENNTFTASGTTTDTSASQCYYGARVVERYNTLNGGFLFDMHGGSPGCRWAEIYNNTWTLPSSAGTYAQANIAQLRGGSSLFYSNHETGTPCCSDPYPGLEYGPLNGSSDPQTGTWPLNWQVGRGIFSSSTYQWSPAYAWGNDAIIAAHTGVAPSPAPNYVWIGTTATNATGSTSQGHATNISDVITPASAPGSIQVCESAADVTAGCGTGHTVTYTAYTYPHPATPANAAPPAPAPTMLVYAVPLPAPAAQPTITGISPTKTYVTKNGCSQDGAKWVNPCLFRVFCGNCSASTSLTLDGTAIAQSYVSGEMDASVPLTLLPVPSTITQHSFSATNPAAVVPVLQ